MNVKWFIKAISISTVLLIFVTSCHGFDQSQSNEGKMLEEVQNKVPFTIILPKYFPAGIDENRFSITGPMVGVNNSTMIALNFGNLNKGKYISIIEENMEYIFEPSNTSTYFKINETMIIEEETGIYKPGGIVKGILYRWNLHNISFKLSLFGYDTDQGRKIVESMVKYG